MRARHFAQAPSRGDIYVVGGLCDYKRVANATLDRAEAAGVEARRLPIEETLGRVLWSPFMRVEHVRLVSCGGLILSEARYPCVDVFTARLS